MTQAQSHQLDESTDMAPVHGTVDIDVPPEVLWQCFRNANLWPRWNACMFWANNRDLVLGQKLIWAFEPIRWWYPYLLPGVANLIEVEENRKVTWEVVIMPGFYARHTYSIDDLGDGRSRFGSWEKAMGPMFRALKFFWIAHFIFVKDRSLQGARLLESIYARTGQLDEATLPKRRVWYPLQNLKALLGGSDILQFEVVSLAPDVWAVLGGGGNSLVVKHGDEALVVDPKMSVYARRLKHWIERDLQARVTTIIDTHYHFDHTRGNKFYPEARIIAHRTVPEAMLANDPGDWCDDPAGMPQPDNLVDQSLMLQFGSHEIEINYAGQAHTIGDMWVRVCADGHDIIATGDFATLDHYPFFDTSEYGADVQGWISAARDLATKYPDATFIPGHGPIATAKNLLHHVAYVTFLDKSVAGSRHDGLDEDGTARNVDLSSWNLAFAPIFHYGLWFLSENTNVRSIYRLQTKRH
ncbi:MAG TPA: MBL fold metallo-hydrolase [Anaerolineae bacterium]|nr:MBL fold metallo-hydrolase [Anaerolineae bacterium]